MTRRPSVYTTAGGSKRRGGLPCCGKSYEVGRTMKILQEVCSIPTAPFAEQYIVQYIERFVKRRPSLKLSRDRWGNLLIELPGRSRGPRWIFAAHMDHPGFIARRMIDQRTLE